MPDPAPLSPLLPEDRHMWPTIPIPSICRPSPPTPSSSLPFSPKPFSLPSSISLFLPPHHPSIPAHPTHSHLPRSAYSSSAASPCTTCCPRRSWTTSRSTTYTRTIRRSAGSRTRSRDPQVASRSHQHRPRMGRARRHRAARPSRGCGDQCVRYYQLHFYLLTVAQVHRLELLSTKHFLSPAHPI